MVLPDLFRLWVSNMNAIALWLTGLPGSGKSTIAEEIKKRHPEFIILRMDELRKVVTPEPSYSEAEREIVYRCLVNTASLMVRQGHDVIIDATGNMRRWRDLARRIIERFGEVYLRCPIDICMERERVRLDTYGAPKEIYEKGKAGWPVPGINVPYEEPLNPEIIIDTDSLSFSDSLSMIEDLVKRLKS